jgi:hypothetical protein
MMIHIELRPNVKASIGLHAGVSAVVLPASAGIWLTWPFAAGISGDSSCVLGLPLSVIGQCFRPRGILPRKGSSIACRSTP